MTTHQIIFLDRETLAPAITLRKPDFPHSWTDFDATGPESVVAHLAGATIAVINKVPLRAETLRQLPDLQLIAICATGTDCVDKDYCAARGLPVTNVRGYAVHTVPEFTLGAILALSRQMFRYREEVIDGAWARSPQFCYFNEPIFDLHGKRLGIVGRGSLGRAVAQRAEAFGMEVVFADRKEAEAIRPGYVSWQEMLETAQVISLHCPLTPETRNLIGWAEFTAMRQRPLIINTARGGLVVEADLLRALEMGMVRGAALDITVPEPPPADHIVHDLAKLPNVLITPHVAWASEEAQQSLADQMIETLEAFVAGAPVNLVVEVAS
ncbi:MAG: D-2-hydroxyacid dehydrogenase [Magnetospiraceae bacterium]